METSEYATLIGQKKIRATDELARPPTLQEQMNLKEETGISGPAIKELNNARIQRWVEQDSKHKFKCHARDSVNSVVSRFSTTKPKPKHGSQSHQHLASLSLQDEKDEEEDEEEDEKVVGKQRQHEVSDKDSLGPLPPHTTQHSHACVQPHPPHSPQSPRATQSVSAPATTAHVATPNTPAFAYPDSSPALRPTSPSRQYNHQHQQHHHNRSDAHEDMRSRTSSVSSDIGDVHPAIVGRPAFFHGAIPRDEAERRLVGSHPGSFLVREKKFDRLYVLTVHVGNNRAAHHLIEVCCIDTL